MRSLLINHACVAAGAVAEALISWMLGLHLRDRLRSRSRFRLSLAGTLMLFIAGVAKLSWAHRTYSGVSLPESIETYAFWVLSYTGLAMILTERCALASAPDDPPTSMPPPA